MESRPRMGQFGFLLAAISLIFILWMVVVMARQLQKTPTPSPSTVPAQPLSDSVK